ncbi:MAG: hypothetical protein M1818_000041 [Claussenomyces sp. TS43310]|nr:MAG: hypothetical protein M1818_000041 [Claussenomyces sp. TS43310]
MTASDWLRARPPSRGLVTNEPNSDETIETGNRLVRDILDNRFSLAEISPSGELFRAIARHNRIRRSGLSREANGGLAPPSRGYQERLRATRAAMDHARDVRRPQNRDQVEEQRNQTASPVFQSPSLSPPIAPSGRQMPTPGSSLGDTRRTRPRMPENDRTLERLRNMAEVRRASASPSANNMLSSLADLHHAGQQLESASSHLRSLLDDPIAPLHTRSITQREYADEAESSRPFKRRRIDRGTTEPYLKPFTYGHYGQVEPGKLKMEIESCDGGIYSEEFGASKFAARNILLNDDSVYCTKGNSVQEGMVFVSMTSDDLLARTAQYQIQYSPRSSRQDDPNPIPPVVSIRHNPDGTTSNEETSGRTYGRSSPNNIPAYRLAQIPSDFALPSSQAFHVTTICSDDDEDNSRASRRRRIADRIGALRWDESDDNDDSEEDQDIGHTAAWHDDYVLDSHSPPPRAERRSTASQISVGLIDAIEAAQDATQEAVRAVGGELMAPHARFFIERDKSKCTIHFDPPISGRFILLKMWSPCHNRGGNIDIQSVVIKGYAGPRFFPAVQLR